MTEKEKKRLNELEQNAIDNYFASGNFNVYEWLEDDETVEYCLLYNMQFEKVDFNCVCGKHD